MTRRIDPPKVLSGEIVPPGDKSISHRAVLFNSMAEGQAVVENFSRGADCLATIACLTDLGAVIEEFLSQDERASRLIVHGVGGVGFREPSKVLSAENSGTTMRMLTGLLSAQPFLSILTGDESLQSRPMDRVVVPLRRMGAQIWGRNGDSLAPLAIRGTELHGIDYEMPVASAQVKSALILAGLYAEGKTRLKEPVPSRDHTEKLFRAMGGRVEVRDGVVEVQRSALKAVDVRVPADISSAAFWMVAGVLHPQARLRLRKVGVNPTRAGVLEVLRAMGARITLENEAVEGGELVADIVVESSPLSGTEISGAIIPRLIDEIPVLAVAASLARGTTVIRDASELRVKESDRIRTTAQELGRLGARIEELPDGMIIHGVGQLRGGDCSTRKDHRLAMTLAVAGLVSRSGVTLDDEQVVGVSYPGFWEDLEKVSLK